MYPGHPERLQNFDYVGIHAYHLRFCTDSKREVFVDESIVEAVLSQIRRAAQQERFSILAYCFMSDHLHVIVRGDDEGSDFRLFADRAKQFSGFYYPEKRHHQLWQRYFYEHVLRDEAVTLQAVRYVLTNPIRAGLVEEIGSYRFAGSDFYTLEQLRELFEATKDRGSGSG